MMFEKLKKFLKIMNFSGSIMLKDGTEILLDGGNLEVGVKCFVELPNADEPIQLPDGEYTLEDGSTIIVVDGMIKEINEPKTEEEIKEEEETEVIEEAEVKPVDAPADAPADQPVETPDPMGMEEKLKELEDRIKSLEESITKQAEEVKQSTQKLQSDYDSLKEKLETSDGAQRLSSVKLPENLSPQEKILRSIKGLKK